MPIRYSRGDRTSNIGTAAACYEIRTGATYRGYIREIGMTLATAAATTIGLGKPAAIGVGPTAPTSGVSEDPANTAASTVQTTMAWGTTAPTAPASFYRRASFGATIGSGIVWTFQADGLVVPVSSSLVLWNILGGATLDVWLVWEE